MLNTFLQTGITDFNSLVGIGAIIAAFVGLIGLLITIRQNRYVRYLEFVKGIDNELAQHIEKETKLDGREECIIYAYNYIDICDRVMFLINRKVIAKDFFEYYHDFFNYAITIMWWYTVIHPEDSYSLKISWPTITRWIAHQNNDAPYPVTHLPKEMQKELANIHRDTTDKTSLHNEIKESIKSVQSTD